MSKIKVIDRIIRSGAAEIASEFLSQDEVAESRDCVCSFIRDGFRPECNHCKYELYDPESGKSYCSLSTRNYERR